MEWHGWKIKDSLGESTTLGVCEFPDRKTPCLYAQNGADFSIEPLAYFRTAEKAQKFLDLLDIIATNQGVE